MVALERQSTERAAATAVSPAGADAIPIGARKAGATPRQAFRIIAIGAVVLSLLASRDLPSWAERLGDTPAARIACHLIAEWDDGLAQLGLTRPHEALRRSVPWLLDREWPR